MAVLNGSSMSGGGSQVTTKVSADVVNRRVRVVSNDTDKETKELIPLTKEKAQKIADLYVHETSRKAGKWSFDVASFAGSYQVVDCYYKKRIL